MTGIMAIRSDHPPSGARDRSRPRRRSDAPAGAGRLDGALFRARYPGGSKKYSDVARVPLVDILQRYGLLKALRRRGARLVGRCPVHGGSNNRQFVVNETDNTWFCFGDCKRGGGTIAFIAALERVTVAEAAARMAQWFAPSLNSPHLQRTSTMGTRPTHKVLAVTERPDGNSSKSHFTRIGVAWPIKGGAGLSLQLDALPVNGRLIVMEFTDDDMPSHDGVSATSKTAT